MKYQCLNNIGIIEKFLFYRKTEYDYDAVAGKKDMLSYATVRRDADTSKTREWSWLDRGKDTILFQTNNLRWALSTTRNCFWNIIWWQRSKIFHLLVRNTTAVFFCECKNLIKSLFANYSLQSSFECCHLNVTHLGSYKVETNEILTARVLLV